jgi:hypothetical protein
MERPFVVLDAAKRRALAVEIGFDLRARTCQTRHHGTDWNALHLGHLAVSQAFEHDQEKRGALFVDQHCERALDVAAAGFRTRHVGRVVILDRRQRRPPRQRTQAVAVEIGENGIKPAAHVAAMKQMLGAKRPHQRILYKVVGCLHFVRERARVSAQRRDRCLNVLMEGAQSGLLRSPCDSIEAGKADGFLPNNTGCSAPIPSTRRAMTDRRACRRRKRMRKRNRRPVLEGPDTLCHRRPVAAPRGRGGSWRKPQVSCAASAV